MKIFSLQTVEGFKDSSAAWDKSKKQRVLVFSVSILLLSALAFFFVKGSESLSRLTLKQEAPRFGSLAPDFELRDLDGKTVRLADFRGKNPIFLNFWASWCPACQQEAPANARLHQRLGAKGLRFMAVSVDQGATTADEVGKFVEKFRVGFVPLLDPEHRVLDLYGVTGIPTTFLIDRKGVIVAKEVGPKNWTSPERLKSLEGLLN
jgi:peroxiredoxin